MELEGTRYGISYATVWSSCSGFLPPPPLFLLHTCTHIKTSVYLCQMCILSSLDSCQLCAIYLTSYVLIFSKYYHYIWNLIGTYLLQYYTDPKSGYVFRSKKDVLRYLESGEISRHALKPKKSCINNAELINSEISVSLHLIWCFSKWILCCAVFSIIILFVIPSFLWQ